MATTGTATTGGSMGGEVDNGFQNMIEGEDVDNFVKSQTTRVSDKFKEDIDVMKPTEKTIDRYIMNKEKNRFLNMPTYDEVIDEDDDDFYINANTLNTPYGSFILTQGPTEQTKGDFFHLLWIYDVYTVIALSEPEYINPAVGGSSKALFKYSAKTLAIFEESHGVTIYQIRLKKYTEKEPRIIYVVYGKISLNGVRETERQIFMMEEMWAQESMRKLQGSKQVVTCVHGISGTRRTSSFISAALMCKQILEFGKFSAMDTWVEVRMRRCGAAGRKQDFYDSLLTAIEYSVHLGYVAPSDPDYKKTIKFLHSAIQKDAEFYAKMDPEG